jgi:dTDP-4-dehydrorhamnose 3,5-epimerase
MIIESTIIPEVLLITPKVHRDDRGYFLESFNQRFFENKTFVQDNQSLSYKNTIRGLHYQVVKPQAKLVRVIKGKILDVAVDIRKDSPTFRKYVAVELSSDNFQQLYIPEGFAHGFQVISDYAEVLYKTTEFWYKDYDRSIRYNDKTINIPWFIDNLKDPLISQKDMNATYLNDADLNNLI